MGDEGANRDPALDRPFQGFFKGFEVKSKNDDVDRLFGGLDRGEHRLDSVLRLYDELHVCPRCDQLSHAGHGF